MPAARSTQTRKGDRKAIFYKALLVDRSLSDPARRVGAVLVDYHNPATGQCDPGTATLIAMAGTDRKSIFRATKKLADAGLIEKLRHGGHGHRNGYVLKFETAIAIVKEWEQRKADLHTRTSETADGTAKPGSDSPTGVDFDSPTGVDFDSPTGVDSKPLNKTNKLSHGVKPQATARRKDRDGLGNEGARPDAQRSILLPFNGGRSTSAANASRAQAERRINDEILAKRPAAYALFVEIAGDGCAAYTAAHQAEAKRRGAGVALMIDHLDQEAARRAGHG